MRIGNGYDVHKLTDNRPLILGGVEIEYEKGLLGHSDADVLVHAIMDALLGAASCGDIGKLFPDNDDKYKALHQVYVSMYNDNKKYGYDYSDLQKNITDWGNRNPLSTSVQGYLRNREKTQSSSSSSSSKGIGTQDFYSLSSRF